MSETMEGMISGDTENNRLNLNTQRLRLRTRSGRRFRYVTSANQFQSVSVHDVQKFQALYKD